MRQERPVQTRVRLIWLDGEAMISASGEIATKQLKDWVTVQQEVLKSLNNRA